MNSTSVVSNLPSPPTMSRPSTSSHNPGVIGLRTPQEGSFSSYDGPSQLFYDSYGASNYPACVYGSTWQQNDPIAHLSRCPCSTNDPSTTPHSSYVLGGIPDSPVLTKHVEFSSRLPPSPPSLKSTLVRDLPPADPATDYMERIFPISILAEDPLSPLSLCQDWQTNQLQLEPFHQELYLSSMNFPRKWTQDRPHQTRLDEDETSPDGRPCRPLQDIHQEFDKWVTSPESVDTELDDESFLSSSTSSLSPPFSESDLRHCGDSEEYNEDDSDDSYPSHAMPTTPSSMINLYHHIEQYPSSHTHLYNPMQQQQCQQPNQILPSHQNGDAQQQSSWSIFLPFQPMLEDLSSPELPPPPLPNTDIPNSPPVFGEPSPSILSQFYDFNGPPQNSYFNQIPCSPSLRRRIADLPPDDDLVCIQNPYDDEAMPHFDPSPEPRQRAQWLSLPGADTDDDLIPLDLASKNYIPDPTITVPTTHSGNLLIWGPTSPQFMPLDLIHVHDDPPAPRSPSPENLMKLDPAMIQELAPEGEAEEAQRLYELRKKTSKQESWERERCRELSALLRLKLKLAEKGESSSDTSEDEERKEAVVEEAMEGVLQENGSSKMKVKEELPSLTHPSSFSSVASIPRRCSSLPASTSISAVQSTSPKINCSKAARIMSMDQLVAKMVFTRQQDLLKRSPPRTRSLPKSSSSSHKMQYQTPRSPLRQVTLPQNLEDDEEVDNYDNSVDVVDSYSNLDNSQLFGLSPSSLPTLCESPSSMLMELDQTSVDEEEHD